MSPLIIAIVGAVLLVLFIAMFILSRIKVAGPNEAFIVTGRKGRAIRRADGTTVTALPGQKVVMGAAVFVMPVVQRLYKLDLSSREIPVQINAAVSAQGIRCDADAVAIVKVGGTAEMIRPAAQRFLHQQDRIEAFTAQVLSGALRAVVGRLTVEQIIRDRAAFAAHVAEEAERALTHQGLILDAFQLEDIRTAGSYLQDLGRPEAARVLNAAAIAEAQARQTAETERMKAEEAIAESARHLSPKQAGVQAEIGAAKPPSAAAGAPARPGRGGGDAGQGGGVQPVRRGGGAGPAGPGTPGGGREGVRADGRDRQDDRHQYRRRVHADQERGGQCRTGTATRYRSDRYRPRHPAGPPGQRRGRRESGRVEEGTDRGRSGGAPPPRGLQAGPRGEASARSWGP